MAKIDPKAYVSIQTGARLAGVSRYYLRELVKKGPGAGGIAGIEIDGYYFALRTACEKWTRDPVGRGRPRIHKADGRA
jgi:hypothetical protein